MEDITDDTYTEYTKLYSFKPFVFVCFRPKFTPLRPHPRSGHRIVCDDANVYSFGGYNPFIPLQDPLMDNDPVWMNHRPLFKELWKFNLSCCTWSKLLSGGDLPDELASIAVVLKGAVLMIYGGTSVPFGSSCSNNLHVCNLRTVDVVRVKVMGDCPLEQYGQALVLDGNYLYTVGGTTGYEYSTDIHRLNLETLIWEKIHISTELKGDPKGRYRHELAFDGTRIYLLGGGTAVEVYGFETVEAYNLKLKQWEVLTTVADPDMGSPGIPAPRRCHGCVQLPADGIQQCAVFISGGYNGFTSYDDIWKLELHTLQWTCIKSCRLPRPVYFHSAALTPSGQMVVFGGIAEVGEQNERTADIHAAWVCIPKLAEICWEALLYYVPHLTLLPKEKLLNIGLPNKYVNRIQSL